MPDTTPGVSPQVPVPNAQGRTVVFSLGALLLFIAAGLWYSFQQFEVSQIPAAETTPPLLTVSCHLQDRYRVDLAWTLVDPEKVSNIERTTDGQTWEPIFSHTVYQLSESVFNDARVEIDTAYTYRIHTADGLVSNEVEVLVGAGCQ